MQLNAEFACIFYYDKTSALLILVAVKLTVLVQKYAQKFFSYITTYKLKLLKV